jgi:hypothetical protein
MAICTLPQVQFLKPTGQARPLINWAVKPALGGACTDGYSRQQPCGKRKTQDGKEKNFLPHLGFICRTKTFCFIL